MCRLRTGAPVPIPFWSPLYPGAFTHALTRQGHVRGREEALGFCRSVVPANTCAVACGDRIPSRAGSLYGRMRIFSWDSAALQFERKRFHAAYANVRGKDDPAKARKGCSTAIGRAVVSLTGMLTVVRRGFPCGTGSTGQSALPNRPTTAPPSVSQSIYPAGSAGCMAHGRAMHGRQRELNLGVMGTIATCCAGFAHEPMFRAGRRMETA